MASPCVDVYIKLPSGRTSTLNLLPSDKVSRILDHLAKEEKVPATRVRLKYQGKVLDKTKTIGYLGVCAETILKGEEMLSSFQTNGRNVEVVFSFDTTGSMACYLDQVRQKLKETCRRLLRDIQSIRIGLIAHGDYCDYDNYVTKYIDLTSDVDQLVSFAKDVSTTGGGDTPECYEWVLKKAQQLDWSEDSAKALVVIGDCEPHPPSYTDQNIDWHAELDVLKGMEVKVYGVHCGGPCLASQFYMELAEQSDGCYLNLKHFNLITDMFLGVCYKEADPGQLDAFTEELKQEGRLTEDTKAIIEKLEEMASPCVDVYIKLPSGRTSTLNLLPSDKVSRILDHLAKEEKVPATRVRLKYQGKVLDKTKTIGYLGVCAETILKGEVIVPKDITVYAKIGLIAHGDYCDYTNYVIRYIDLTSDVDQLVSFAKGVSAIAGGDPPECYEWVLKKAQQLDWSEDSAKALVVIGDFYPHPPSYTDQKIDWHADLDVLKGIGVKAYGVHCGGPCLASQFYMELAEQSDGCYLNLKHFNLITDMFLGEELQQEGKLKEDTKAIIEKVNESKEVKDKKIKEAPKRYLSESWWDFNNDNGKPRYKYIQSSDTWEPINNNKSCKTSI
ncbi:hypothetical protein KUTeg_018306, partial [Tegillarca granosa]